MSQYEGSALHEEQLKEQVMTRRRHPTHTQQPVLLISSAAADGLDRTARPSELLQAAGVVVGQQLLVSDLESLESLKSLGRQRVFWHQPRFSAIVAAGGDGTVGAAASLCITHNLPLGILPMGISNDVARSLGIPLNLGAASDVIAHGACVAIDAGWVLPRQAGRPGQPGIPGLEQEQEQEHVLRCVPPWMATLPRSVLSPLYTTLQRMVRMSGLSGLSGLSGQRRHRSRGLHFVHAATLGLNVEFARRATDGTRREQWGNLTYVMATLEALTHFQPIPVTMQLSGVPKTLVPRTSPDDAGQPDDALRAARAARAERDARGALDVLDAGDRTIRCQAVQVTVLNTPVIGGGLNLHLPGVEATDQLLDILVIEALDLGQLRKALEGWLTTMQQLSGGILASHADEARHAESNAESVAAALAEQADASVLMPDPSVGFVVPGVRRLQARHILLETPSSVEITLDGEIRACTPAEISIAPGPLQVLVPRLRRTAPNTAPLAER
jgi:diacylglycerol kinase family enzyme